MADYMGLLVASKYETKLADDYTTTGQEAARDVVAATITDIDDAAAQATVDASIAAVEAAKVALEADDGSVPATTTTLREAVRDAEAALADDKAALFVTVENKGAVETLELIGD